MFKSSVRVLAYAGFCIIAGLSTNPAWADGVAPRPMTGNPNLVVFPYDPNNSYEIFARPKAVTTLKLEPDERVKILAAGDSIAWEALTKDNFVFIRPKYDDTVTTATLVTNKRDYNVVLRSTHERGKFYQQVTWDYSPMMTFATEIAGDKSSTSDRSAGRSASGPGIPVDLSEMNFNYDISGDDRIKPRQIFDDGTMTYIQMPPASEDMPALFRLVDGEAELLNYTVKGNWIIRHGVIDQAVMRLGKYEVTIRNRSKRSSKR